MSCPANMRTMCAIDSCPRSECRPQWFHCSGLKTTVRAGSPLVLRLQAWYFYRGALEVGGVDTNSRKNRGKVEHSEEHPALPC